MKITLRVRTPTGQAKATAWKLKPFLIARRAKHTTYVNDEDNEIVWTIEGDVKAIVRAQKNVALFGSFVENVFTDKKMQKHLRQYPKELYELEDMLKNQTSVEIIKEATLQEIDEFNETLWQKIKRKYKEFTL